MADSVGTVSASLVGAELAELVVSVREHHIDLVELICDAANSGVEPWMEAVYVARSRWFRDHWRYLRGHLTPWMAAHPDDVHAGEAVDPFEMLFLPESVSAMLSADDGGMIGRLGRCQSILEQWEAAVRRGEVRA
ncbi:MAG: hypothetical protein ACKO5K_02145 [Armatimonadota bacterium]